MKNLYYDDIKGPSWSPEKKLKRIKITLQDFKEEEIEEK